VASRFLIAVSIALVVVSLSFAVAYGALGSTVPLEGLRSLARAYVTLAYAPWNKTLTVMSPEAVTSIVWDFRGVDTFFETAVLFGAIIGTVTLFRGIKPSGSIGEGLSVVTRAAAAVTAPMILAVAAAIALHGHLTPGGGFQGGATAAVVALVILVTFSIGYLVSGFSKERALMLRSAGLLGIAAVALIPPLLGGLVFQNQEKALSQFSYPAYIGGALTSGSLLLYNIFESLAVAAGLTLTIMLLLSPHEVVEEAVRGEEHERV